MSIIRNKQFYKFSAYGFLKNLRFFDAFLILFLIEKGISYTHIGILYAAREIIINVFEIPSGIIADSYGRKTALVSSFVFYIASFLIFHYSFSFGGLMLAFLLFGMGDAFRSGTHKGMIMDYLQLNNWSDKKIEYYGHTRSWSQTGSAISSLVAGILVFAHGNYEQIFLYSCIPYVFNFLLIISYPKELNRTLKKFNSKVMGNTIKIFIQQIKNPKVLVLINSTALHTAFLKSIKDYIQIVMILAIASIPFQFSNVEMQNNGIAVGVFYFIIFLLTAYASRISVRLERNSGKKIVWISLLLGLGAGLFSGIFFNIQLHWISLLLFVSIFFIENVRKPILTAYVANQVPTEILSSVISAQSQLKTIYTVLIALLVGFLADRFSIGTSIFFVSISLLVLSILLHLWAKGRRINYTNLVL